MPKLFISYRRSDTRKDAARLYDRLVPVFGKENVFKDVDTVAAGADFRKEIVKSITRCDVVLVLIGTQWLTSRDERGIRRIDLATDWVRFEIECALNHNHIRVIPLLVDNASPPSQTALPESIRQLVYKQALPLRDDPDFHKDADRLIDELHKFFSEKPASHKHRVEVSTALPAPFEWCSVPAGLVTLDDASDFGGTSGGNHYLPAFMIGKYPITTAQYAEFLTALDGYRSPNWWAYSPEAATWRAQHPIPTKPQFTGSTLPRTNVSWYDAVAFCHWLSAKSNYIITLPTEQQWQRAAQGDDHRLYSTGNVLDKDHVHFTGTLVGQPTPVDLYPSGASPFGVMDMCGNVWEWCLTLWDTAMPLPDPVPLTGRAKRSVRGGSWGVNSEELLQTTFRHRLEPDCEGYHVGFRCVRLID